MLIWQGLGAFAFVVPFFAWFLAILIGQSVLGKAKADELDSLHAGIALLVSAGILWWLAQRLARRPVRTLVDKETGQEVVLRESHTMFFVPIRYWAMLDVAAGAALVVVGLLP